MAQTFYKTDGGGGGGQVKFYPYEKGVGGTKRVGVVLPWELEVLPMLEGGGRVAKSFRPLKGGGGANIFTLSWGRGWGGVGGHKVSNL